VAAFNFLPKQVQMLPRCYSVAYPKLSNPSPGLRLSSLPSILPAPFPALKKLHLSLDLRLKDGYRLPTWLEPLPVVRFEPYPQEPPCLPNTGVPIMTMSRDVILCHSPQSRSAGVLHLLEELGAGYTLKVLDLRKGEQRSEEYLAINPMGKVPAVIHDGAVVTEQVAVYIYLGDLYADSGLAPQSGDPRRGDYLRWIAYYGSCFEPAVVDVSMKREPPPPSMSPYGTFDQMFKVVLDRLEQGPYLLGDQFSVADVLWGNALAWMTMFKLVPALPVVDAYVKRTMERPAKERATQIDAEILASRA
jgi:glutathione S-transferase